MDWLNRIEPDSLHHGKMFEDKNYPAGVEALACRTTGWVQLEAVFTFSMRSAILLRTSLDHCNVNFCQISERFASIKCGFQQDWFDSNETCALSNRQNTKLSGGKPRQFGVTPAWASIRVAGFSRPFLSTHQQNASSHWISSNVSSKNFP